MPTMKVFGQDVEKKYIVLAAAGGVVFVGYMWLRRRNEAPAGPTQDDYGVTEYTPPGQVPVTQAATGDYSGITDEVPTTNPQWVTLATQRLSDLGFEALLVARALGKYVTRQKLTADEIDVVRTAIGQTGLPPQGNPFPIDPALPSPNPAPGQTTTKTVTVWESHHVAGGNLREIAKRYAAIPSNATSVESTLRSILARNPFLKGKTTIGNAILWIPVRKAVPA